MNTDRTSTLDKVIEELQAAIYRGLEIRESLAKDGIELTPLVNAKLEGTIEGYHQAIAIIRGFLGHEGEVCDRLQ